MSTSPVPSSPSTPTSSKSCTSNSSGLSQPAAIAVNSSRDRKQQKYSTKVVDPNAPKRPLYEMDPVVLTRREKQIITGKLLPCYRNYVQAVPREERKEEDPKTPNKLRNYSRRAWDGLVRKWKIELHAYDDPKPAGSPNDPEENAEGVAESDSGAN